MNPWSSKKYKKVYDNSDVRTGIALRFEKGVHSDIKSLFTDFTKWLRKNYCFPIRIVVYIKESETIKLMNEIRLGVHLGILIHLMSHTSESRQAII